MATGGIKGVGPTPNMWLKKRLSEDFVCFDVDEFRTSMVHFNRGVKCSNYMIPYEKLSRHEIEKSEKKKAKYCNKKLTAKTTDAQKTKEKKLPKKVHGLLTIKVGKKVVEHFDRDMKASNNMNKIVKSYVDGHGRPLNYVRGTIITRNKQHKEQRLIKSADVKLLVDSEKNIWGERIMNA